MKITTTLLGLAAVGFALAGCAPGSVSFDDDESTAERGDELKAKKGSCVDSCGGKTQSKGGNCWCDEECVEFGDCCADYEDVCEAAPEPELCLTDASCGAGQYCDHTECLSNCPDGMVCPAVCYGQCLDGAPVQHCGGFAGLQCPGGMICIDDPADDCDPNNGGADCGGICIDGPGGEPCGSSVCGAGSFCCNESCGICAPDGGACTQQVCAPTE
ncbi:MAG: hypothetical protein HOW73_31830 [Polyangiaceae bacterium]|nr:hypothetical protein [Polyangiaceae bacterium]